MGRLLTRLAAWEQAVACTAFLVLVIVVFADVVTREVTGTGIHWAPQAGVYANFVVVMLGFGLASATGTHLRPRFADHWLPARWEPVLVRLQHICMALACLALAAGAVAVVAETRMLGDRSPALGNLVWPIQALLPVVFATAAARHAAYARWPTLAPGPYAGPGTS